MIKSIKTILSQDIHHKITITGVCTNETVTS